MVISRAETKKDTRKVAFENHHAKLPSLYLNKPGPFQDSKIPP
jgi:hypothetical protein